MKIGFYSKLAWDGINKNKRLYLPYILTCVGMVMMYYTIVFLSGTPALKGLRGSDVIETTLSLGSFVMAFFAILFLFYSNSFLLRRRKKEFGLYNILGMGKRNISKILFWESCIVAGLAVIGGIVVGVGLSKLFELGLVNMLAGSVSYNFTISIKGIVQTVLIFGIIFALLFLNGLRQVSLSNPISLLRSENAGEKPPKANWLFGIAGIVILGIAYYIAVSIEDPLTALVTFFQAVVMVILATYLLFVAGSVMLCKLLQKNKGYYYKARHFVSVSSMAYRMKRNGAGLASICILLTMVLVMLSATIALFAGTKDSLNLRYPRDITIGIKLEAPEYVESEVIIEFREKMESIFAAEKLKAANIQDYSAVGIAGLLKDGYVSWDNRKFQDFDITSYSYLTQVYFVSLNEYNRIIGEELKLEADEVFIYSYRVDYNAPVFQLDGGKEYRVKALLKEFQGSGNAAMDIVPVVFVVVPELTEALEPLAGLTNVSGDKMLQICKYYGFDLDVSAEEEITFYQELQEVMREFHIDNDSVISSVSIECLENERAYIYAMHGGILYLGIILSIVFLTAAVLIIYYKQISEGYEDQARFENMQKVGMTKKDIRKSINSQMLTVFFLPLITAGLHLCFALPIIDKLLRLFNLWNTQLLISTTVACFVIFGLLYTLVYRITSNAYYSIVSGAKEA